MGASGADSIIHAIYASLHGTSVFGSLLEFKYACLNWLRLPSSYNKPVNEVPYEVNLRKKSRNKNSQGSFLTVEDAFETDHIRDFLKLQSPLKRKITVEQSRTERRNFFLDCCLSIENYRSDLSLPDKTRKDGTIESMWRVLCIAASNVLEATIVVKKCAGGGVKTIEHQNSKYLIKVVETIDGYLVDNN